MRLAYVSRGWTGHDERFVAGWRSLGVEVVTFAIPLAECLGERRTMRVRELRHQLGMRQVDIVQAGPATEPGSLVSAAWDGPLIITSWGFDLLDEAIHDGYLRVAAERALEAADLLFVDSSAAHHAALLRGVNAAKVVQFPWGLEEFWLQPAPRARRGDVFEVITTRNHEQIYRVGDVLRGFALAREMGANMHLTVVGSGSLTPDLQAEALRLGIKDTTFTGFQDRETIQDFLRGSDAYVTASEVDGSSLSLLEAMASGPVVIASNTPGNSEWISNVSGHLFDVGDIRALAHALLEVKSKPEASKSRAAAAHSMVHERARWVDYLSKFDHFASRAFSAHATRRNNPSAGLAKR